MSIKEKILPRADADLSLAFDVGHSSIGWAVLQQTGTRPNDINILGCGAVIFRADDCLVSSRRAYRRQRRHIRSTRQRIARIKILLHDLGVLTKTELDKPGCAWPWLLAARVLRGGRLLTWPELWDILRWYAHNRGYDGNRRWSAAETDAQKKDSEKEAMALSLMDHHKTGSMAETFCAICGLDPLGTKRSTNLPGDKRPKGQNAAFPRRVVESEVTRILQAHFGKLAACDTNLEKALLSDWRAVPCPGLKLPRRYEGGLLSGQLVPRFDNRIISICPISEQKVPSRNCPEFLNFRWAMQLANIRVGKATDRELSPLNKEQRIALDQEMRQRGYLTPQELKDAVRSISGCQRDNLETMLMHPDAKEALLLDPVQKLVSSGDFQPFWKLLPERLQKRLRGQWRRGKSFSLKQIREQLAALADATAFDAEIQRQLDTHNSKAKKKENQLSPDGLLMRHVPSKAFRLDGRAAFSRPLLKKAFEEVLAGGPHPKEQGGCLYITEQMREAQLRRSIADQTNNHLVRHRLLILERLLGDIIKEYANGDKSRVAKMTIEVNRDLREMSGKTAKEQAQDLGRRIANHHAVAEKLEKAFAEQTNVMAIPITAGLIRKGRVAEDLGWVCPYTGKPYDALNLAKRSVDKDHIVPRSQRASDSLDSLVVTFSEINKWKGNRTAWQFVAEEQGKQVPGLPNLSILSLSRYKQFVDGLETYKGHDDDRRRKKKRKELMLLPKYEEQEFKPRDLTATSQLVRLGAMALKREFLNAQRQPIVVSLPGSVTGTARKAWDLLGCLGLANPEVFNADKQVKSKTEIRDITHLHHALDACVLGLVSYYIPNNGHIWELMIKRSLNEAEKAELAALGIFGFNAEKRFQMLDLNPAVKEQVRQRLAEKRVVQHIPRRMDGLRVEQNTWRVIVVKNDQVILQQRIRQTDGSRLEKVTEEKPGKLLGLNTGKLARKKGALVIPDNFGVALDPQPTIIPFHKVWPRLQELKKQNSGKLPRVLRNGQIIKVHSGKNFKGVWKVFSAKNNASGMALDIGSPDVVRLKNKTEGHKINVRLATLIKDGLELVETPLTGIAVCPITSSA